MKRIVLMAVVAAGLLVPSTAFVSNAGADNPHGTPPGQGDTNASCGGSSGAKPDSCNSANLPFSEGCADHGQGQNQTQNPHCQQTTTTSTPSASIPAPTAAPGAGAAGAENQGAANPANAKAAGAAQGGGNLPFTGLDAVWLALLGAGLLASGLALWARSWLKLPANY
jgi:hypothetical protein